MIVKSRHESVGFFPYSLRAATNNLIVDPREYLGSATRARIRIYTRQIYKCNFPLTERNVEESAADTAESGFRNCNRLAMPTHLPTSRSFNPFSYRALRRVRGFALI